MKRQHRSQADSRSRRGAVLVAAIVCMLIVMTMLANMLQGALRARRQLHCERDLRQTELLLRAGIERATYRLAAESDYDGETWALPALEVVGGGSAKVTIEVSRPLDQESSQLHVVAEYPVGNVASIRRSRTLTFTNRVLQNQE